MKRFSILLLDLDQTLYPASNGLWGAVGYRINDFMVSRIGIESDRVSNLRAQYLQEYGTTLNGLRANFDIDPADYLEYIHDVPIDDFLQPNRELREMLQKVIPSRVIFTNAHTPHAQRVLHALGIEDLISEIIDILALEYINKPQPDSYQRALSILSDPSPEACVLVDDRIDNLVPAKALGMTTVLVQDEENEQGAVPSAEGIVRIDRIEELLNMLPELAR